MTEFDRRVLVGLQRLDAAVPLTGLPRIPRRKPLARRRQVLLLLAATIAVITATSLAASGSRVPRSPAEQVKDAADEELVRNDLSMRMGDTCLSRAEATAIIRTSLAALGLPGWSIRADDRIREAPCVGAAPVGDSHEVLLTPSMGGAVAYALDQVSAQLMGTCLARDDSVNLIRSALVNAGIRDPRIEVGGVRGVPLEFGDAYLKHVADGCFVYAGAQFDDVGRYTWFLAGR